MRLQHQDYRNQTTSRQADGRTMDRAARTVVEPLEQRRLLAAVSWDGGGDGTNWMDANNWSANMLPTADDDVTINVAGNPNIVIGSGTARAKTLVSHEALTIDANLTVASTATFNANVQWLDGTLGGQFTISPGVTATFAGTDGKLLSGAGTTFQNNGTVNYTGSGLALSASLVFNNNGTFNLTGMGNIGRSGSGTPTFNNAGTFNKTASSTVSGFNTVIFNNTGTLNIAAGGLDLGRGGSTTTPINVPAGTSLTFSSGSTILFQFNVGGAVLGGAGTITLAAGILQFNQPNSTINNLNMDGGSLSTATGNTLTLGGTFNFSEGELSGSHVIPAGATANFTGTGAKDVDTNSALRNYGTINYSGANFRIISTTAIFENHGTFNLTGSGNIHRSGSAVPTFHNYGTFNKTTSATTSTFNTVNFNNYGTLNVNAGTLAGHSTPVTGGGSINVAASAIFNAHSIIQGAASTAGRINLSSSAVASRVTALDLTGSGTIDVGGNGLIVDYTGGTPIGTINSKVLGAYNNGAWNGAGINSSAIDNGMAIGFGEASELVGPAGGTWAGTPVDGSAVLIRATLGGDANLDRSVNFDDLLILAQNYGQSGKFFTHGNFNYTAGGQVDFDDLLILAQQYGRSLLSAVTVEPVAEKPLAAARKREPAAGDVVW